MELDSGRNDPLLPGFAITGGLSVAYDVSPDGHRVVVVARDRDGKQQLWLTPFDRQSPPHQIPNVEGDMPMFGADGEIFFRAIEGKSAFVYRVREDGTGLRKAIDPPVAGLKGISPDGQWLLVKVPGAQGSNALAFPLTGGTPIIISTGIVAEAQVRWSQDRNLMFIWIPNGAMSAGPTYVIPVAPGQAFPSIPAGGFRSEEDIAKLPGVRVIDTFATPGTTAGSYAISRHTIQRNLFRIPLQ